MRSLSLVALAWATLPAMLLLSAQAQHLSASHLPNGVRVHEARQVLEITALREDVLRVRRWADGEEPEDASWAVLPEALHSTFSVTREGDGFGTPRLHVSLEPNLAITVTDAAGNVLQQEAEPTLRRGADFRVYQQFTAEDHFFGLGAWCPAKQDLPQLL